jgi:hypothetical protein
MADSVTYSLEKKKRKNLNVSLVSIHQINSHPPFPISSSPIHLPIIPPCPIPPNCLLFTLIITARTNETASARTDRQSPQAYSYANPPRDTLTTEGGSDSYHHCM